MKNQLRRLKALEKMIDLNQFYVVSIAPGEVNLQGHFNASLVVALRALRFMQTGINDYGYVKMMRSNIEVTLT